VEEDKGLVNGTAATSFAQDEDLCNSATELIVFYKKKYEKITGEAHVIQEIVSENTHHIDQWEGALRMAEEAIAKLNSSSSNEDILQAHITLKRLIAISPIPVVNMVTFSEIKLPLTILPPSMDAAWFKKLKLQSKDILLITGICLNYIFNSYLTE